VFVQVTPLASLSQLRSPALVAVPYWSGLSLGSITVSPAHTSAAAPRGPTARPCPKSTTGGQDFGRGGSVQVWCLMSHRTPPSMIRHEMFPLGVANAVRRIVRVAVAAAVDVLVLDVGVLVVVTDDVALLELVLGAPLTVETTVTVFEPHPARASTPAITAMIVPSRTRRSVPPEAVG
jgi:hypothetical protein